MSVRKDEIHVATLRELAEAHVEIARLTKALDEREADMHMRIRAGYDKTVADAWRAEVEKRDAEIARLTAELAAARAEVDCGQDGPCAKAPGCARHWQERNRELVAELAAARAVTAGVCRYLDCAASDLLAVVTSLYETRARAISDATAARGTVGGLLATAPVGSIVEWMAGEFRGQSWRRVVVGSDPVNVSCWLAVAERWSDYAVPIASSSFGMPARLVPAAEADADPNQRGMRRESHFVQIRAADLEELATTEQARGVDVANAAGIVALRNAAPALIAEVRALRAAAEEREADMHARIRAGYDKTVADAWRAEVAKRDAEIARLTAELAAARAVPADVEAALCDSSCWICDREDPIRGANLDRVKAAIARAISDATAARGTVGGLLATAPVGAIVEFVDCAFWYQARVHVDDSVEWYETRRRHATDARWMPWKRGIPPVRPSARLVPAAEADADPSQRGPLPKGG